MGFHVHTEKAKVRATVHAALAQTKDGLITAWFTMTTNSVATKMLVSLQEGASVYVFSRLLF